MNNKKILIVDDNLVVTKALSMKLAAEGYETYAAQDGSSAINLARRHCPDLLLLDLNFPAEIGMSWDGYSIMNWLFTALRPPGQHDSTPVIVMTAEGNKNKDRCLRMGAAAFFQKPLDHAELLRAIRKCLGEEVPAPAQA
jgi:CheY-like chemotaxis protein